MWLQNGYKSKKPTKKKMACIAASLILFGGPGRNRTTDTRIFNLAQCVNHNTTENISAQQSIGCRCFSIPDYSNIRLFFTSQCPANVQKDNAPPVSGQQHQILVSKNFRIEQIRGGFGFQHHRMKILWLY